MFLTQCECEVAVYGKLQLRNTLAHYQSSNDQSINQSINQPVNILFIILAILGISSPHTGVFLAGFQGIFTVYGRVYSFIWII